LEILCEKSLIEFSQPYSGKINSVKVSDYENKDVYGTLDFNK